MQSGLELYDPKHYYRAIKEQRKQDFDYCCAYCGDRPDFLTIDHIIPRSQGGTNYPSNLLPACVPCNQSKGSKELARWYTAKNHRYSAERWLMILAVIEG